jgi:hypothetical protein
MTQAWLDAWLAILIKARGAKIHIFRNYGAALAVSVRAGDFKLPDDNPVASFTIPASWSPSEYEDGVEATSDDGSIYIAVEAADISSSDDVSSAC